MENRELIPPYDSSLERAVLGACILKNKSINKVIDVLVVEDFYTKNHQLIYLAIGELFQRGEKVDMLTVKNLLQKQGKFEEVGGSYYLQDCVKNTTTLSNIDAHCKIIKSKSRLRQVTQLRNIVEMAYDPMADISIIQAELQKQVFDIFRSQGGEGFMEFRDCLMDTIGEVQRAIEDNVKFTGLSTGIPELDEKLGGLVNGNVYVLGGRPSMGKTGLLIFLAYKMAGLGTPVGVFSLEMNYKKLVHRILSTETKIDSSWFRQPQYIGKEGEDKIAEAAKRIHKLPLYIDDTAALSSLNVFSRTRQIVLDKGVKCIFIDYLQRMQTGNSRDKKNYQYAELVKDCARIAKDCDIPVVLLAQLSRDVESPDNKANSYRPVTKHLGDTSEFDRTADVIMFIYRAQHYAEKGLLMTTEQVEDPKDPQKTIKVPAPHKQFADGTLFVYPEGDLVELIIDKHRDGSTGVIKLLYNKEHNDFKPLSERQDPFPTDVKDRQHND